MADVAGFLAQALGIAVGAYTGYWVADHLNAWITRRLTPSD